MNDDTTLSEIRHDVKLCLHLLTGNGDPSSGVVVRLDRLEQSRKAQKWWSGFLVPAGIGAAMGAVGSWLKGQA